MKISKKNEKKREERIFQKRRNKKKKYAEKMKNLHNQNEIKKTFMARSSIVIGVRDAIEEFKKTENKEPTALKVPISLLDDYLSLCDKDNTILGVSVEAWHEDDIETFKDEIESLDIKNDVYLV